MKLDMTVTLSPKAKDSKPNATFKPRNRLKRALFLVTVSSAISVFIVTSSAQAFLSEMFDSDIWQTIDEVVLNNLGIEQWLEILDGIIDDPCKDFPSAGPFVPTEGPWCQGSGGDGGGSGDGGSTPEIGDIIKDSQGEMGIPNPNAVRGRIDSGAIASEAADIPDAFEVNKVVWGTYAGNQVDRDLTRLGIETVLGATGQQRMKQETNSTQSTVKGIVTDADEAQKLDVTQDVMKKQIRIFAQQSLILGAMRADAMQARVDTQYTNLNITNISRSLDEANRARRVEDSAQAAKLLFIASQSHLH
jgi:hypothetical protein